MTDDEYIYDFEVQENYLRMLESEDPFLAAFSRWLEGFDYDAWKEAVMPEDGPDGMTMVDYANDLRHELASHGITLHVEEDE